MVAVCFPLVNWHERKARSLASCDSAGCCAFASHPVVCQVANASGKADSWAERLCCGDLLGWADVFAALRRAKSTADRNCRRIPNISLTPLDYRWFRDCSTEALTGPDTEDFPGTLMVILLRL